MHLSHDLFRALRLKSRKKQAEIARSLGIDRTSVVRIEKGERQLSATEAAAWASACGYDLALVGPEQEAITKLTAALSPDEQRLLAHLAAALPLIRD